MFKTNRQISQELFEEMDRKIFMEEAINYSKLKNKSKALYYFNKCGHQKDKDKSQVN